MITDVAKWIHEIGMTPSELGEALDLPRSQISRLIAGDEKPDKLIGWALAGLQAASSRDPGRGAPKTKRFAVASALAEEIADDTWTGQTARLALPILVELAAKRQTITYGQLHDRVVQRGGKSDIGNMTKYAFPLGRIAAATERLELPPLTAIVVKSSNGLPSSGIDGFIVNFLELNRERAKALKNSEEVRRELVETLWDAVFSYKDWPNVMKKLGVTGEPSYDR